MCENNLSPDFFTEHLIDPNNIWGNDDLERKPFADDLTHKVEHAAKRQSFAVSLHGDWGTGKTYLLRRWQVQLQKHENQSPDRPQAVYFNAWKDDFQADPLVAILGQMREDLDVIYAEKLTDTVTGKASKLLTKIVLDLVRFYTSGAIDLSSKDIASPAENILDEYKEMRASVKLLRECLTQIALDVKTKTNFPLVFIVDELDRCRPTFAIEVLERIKHLFNVPNIVFVFGVNKTELRKSIKSVYGNIDAEDYLRRFFDIGLTLPPASARAYCMYILSQNQDLVDALDVRHHSSWPEATNRLFAPLVGYMNLPLRQVEHAFRLLRVAINARNAVGAERVSVDGWGISLLILLKMKNPVMYAEFISGKVRCADVVDLFLTPLPDPLGVAEPLARLVESSIYCLARGDEKIKIQTGLQCLEEAKNLDSSIADFLAKRTRQISSGQAWGIARDIEQNAREPDPRRVAAKLLDLTDGFQQ